MADNRYIRARVLAGLSSSQAARILGVHVEDLRTIERSRQPHKGLTAQRLAEVYGCSVEWLAGQVPQLDYGALEHVPGNLDLAFCDRDALAEFLALQPKEAP